MYCCRVPPPSRPIAHSPLPLWLICVGSVTCQQAVQLIVSPAHRAICDGFIVVPSLVEVKIVLGSATRSTSLSAQGIFSTWETRRRGLVEARLDTREARIDIKLGESVDVFLGCLIRGLEVMGDIMEGLTKLGVVHRGGCEGIGAEVGRFAQSRGLDRRAESMRFCLSIAMLECRGCEKVL